MCRRRHPARSIRDSSRLQVKRHVGLCLICRTVPLQLAAPTDFTDGDLRIELAPLGQPLMIWFGEKDGAHLMLANSGGNGFDPGGRLV